MEEKKEVDLMTSFKTKLDKIWHMNVAKRVMLFIWKAMKEGLPTRR